MTSDTPVIVCFGDFRLDKGARELRRSGELVDIEPKTYELLEYLLEHRDRAVSKDELQEAVWKTIVTDSAVARAVMKLRKHLGDADESCIKTVPRFGYRFVAELEEPAERRVASQQTGARRDVLAAVAVVALLIGIGVYRFIDEQSVVTDRSIAVLPFDDLSPTQDQLWFADGLTEEILNSLARTPDLLVAARTSSFSYRDANLDVPTIAAELGVAHVLEGSVRRDEARLRVTVQLIRASDGFHLWSDNYDYDAADLIEVQERIAASVANALDTAMDPEALAQLISSGTRSVAAFEAYLEGLAGHAQMRRTGAILDYTESLRHFERAVEHDPEFALAHAEIADFWAAQLSPIGIEANRVRLPRQEMLGRYRAAIDSAIRFAPDSARELQFRLTQAVDEMRLRQALEWSEELIIARPYDRNAMIQHVYLLAALNRYDEIVELADDFYERSGHDSLVTARLLFVMNYSNNIDAIRQLVDNSEEHLRRDVVSAYQMHRSLLWIGDNERAQAILRRILASEMSADNRDLAELRQTCAEGRVDDAELIYGQRFADSDYGVAIRWLAAMIVGRNDEAGALLQPFDTEERLTAFGGFLLFGSFDPTPYPTLMAHLAVHGNEDGYIARIPYRCVAE